MANTAAGCEVPLASPILQAITNLRRRRACAGPKIPAAWEDGQGKRAHPPAVQLHATSAQVTATPSKLVKRVMSAVG